MNEDVKLRKIDLDDHNNFTVTMEKELEDVEILKFRRIRCNDYPSLCEGIEKYVSQHIGEWDLKDNESVGFLIKGNQEYNISRYTFKKIVFYRIRDFLD